MFRERILLTFSVTGDTRFISHQDLMRVFQRAARRADLSVASTQGFNPRPRIAILQARGVGVSSNEEFAELDFEDWVGPNRIKDVLNPALPQGIEVTKVVLSSPRAHARVSGFTYQVDFSGTVPFTPDAVEKLLDGPEILVERQRKGKTKTVNVRPAVDDIRITNRSVVMKFKVTDQGSVRAEEILTALGMGRKDILSQCAITRTEMNLNRDA